MKLEVGKKYTCAYPNNIVEIIHDVVHPCRGHGRFVGKVGNGLDHYHIETYNETGKAMRHNAEPEYDITGEAEEYAVCTATGWIIHMGSAASARQSFPTGAIYKRVESEILPDQYLVPSHRDGWVKVSSYEDVILLSDYEVVYKRIK